jgi:hypothetical protein
MAARGLVLNGVKFVGIFDAFNPDISEETQSPYHRQV